MSMKGKYVVFKLDRAKLLKACNDAGVRNFTDLAIKCGVSGATITRAFRMSDSCVTLNTAYKISNALGIKANRIGRFLEKTASEETDRKPAAKQDQNWIKAEAQPMQMCLVDAAPYRTISNPVVEDLKKEADKLIGGGTGTVIFKNDEKYIPQLQPILREIKRQNELLETLVKEQNRQATKQNEEQKKQTELLQRLVNQWEGNV